MVGIEHKYFICHCWFYLLHDSLEDAIDGVAFCGGGVTGVGHSESCDLSLCMSIIVIIYIYIYIYIYLLGCY